MIELIREIINQGKGVDKGDNIDKYENYSGVWILVGKEKNDSSLVCLQVGQSSNISKEFNKDISYLKDKNLYIIEKKYVNQFGEYMFTYYDYPDRQQMLYNYISQNYNSLTFICVAYGKEISDDMRKKLEKYVAYKTSCRYWANGGVYSPKSKEESETIKKRCKEESEELFKEIQKDFKEKANSIKVFLDNLVSGKIVIPD